mgnify:FL=1
MTSDEIKLKKIELEDKFKSLEQSKKELSDKINEINAEQLRIQGKFQMLTEMDKPEVVDIKEE